MLLGVDTLVSEIVIVYQAAVRSRSVAARAVQHIIEKFCAGSVEQFLVGMVDDRRLHPGAARLP